MTFFKKLATLLTQKPKPSPQEPNKSPNSSFDHLSPISQRIDEWLTKKDWRYEHIRPEKDDELRTHHFIIGFRDEDFFWNCLIIVHEKNQLISFQGALIEEIEPKYYLPIIAMFNALNFSLGIGSLDFDVISGSVRAKIGVDGEFFTLTDSAINCYFYNIASLTEKAWQTVQAVLQDPDPAQDFLAVLTEQGILESKEEIEGFYVLNNKSRLS